MILDNYVSLERLQQIAEYYNKQEGSKYPCSNQIVCCGIVTNDREKAINFMKDKDVIEKRETSNSIKWFLNNGEIWVWRNWNDLIRGDRLYKVAIDRWTDENMLNMIILPKCSSYCYSMEII